MFALADPAVCLGGVQDFEALKDMLSKFDSVNVIIPDGPGESLLLHAFLQTCLCTEASQVALTEIGRAHV